MGRPGSDYSKRKNAPESGAGTEQAVVFTEAPPTRPSSIKHDNGFLDKYPKRAPTPDDYMRLFKWRSKMSDGRLANFVGIRDLPDALDAYAHFLEGKGKDRHLAYSRFVNNDESGTVVYNYSLFLVRQAVEAHYRTKYEAKMKAGGATGFQLTSSAIAVGGKDDRFPYPTTENWQKTLGAHFLWLSTSMNVFVPSGGGVPLFNGVWTLHAEDRYNFNPGAKDIATGTPDDDNGVFEVTGLAQQYTNYATMHLIVQWSGATPNMTYILYDMPATW